MAKLDFNAIPQDILDLPAKDLNFVMLIALDGHLSDWDEAFDALNECGIQAEEQSEFNATRLTSE